METNSKLENAAKTALLQCMDLKKNESCLIITDKNKLDIGTAFYEQAKLITDSVKIIEIPELKVNGAEPELEVAEEMLKYAVIMIPTTKSMSHTNTRRKAVENGARIASMPGITEDMAIRCLNADYIKIRERSRKLADLMTAASSVHITSPKGTDINMDLKDLKCSGADAGIFDKPGKWGNLPEGEACMGPREGTTNGVFIVDLTMAGVGRVETPIKITVKEGFAVSIEGGKEADKLRELLKSMDDKRVYTIAEIGIGTNDKAIITGNTLEDEKVMGTAHIALGNNISYDGGTTDAPIHLDGVFDKPTIFIDGKMIIEDGIFLI
ncbi:MAG: aminopeptidase [Nanoarchaeota archaeon]|nr:aminopeptidase [Nanoarchaeota archaeon]